MITAFVNTDPELAARLTEQKSTLQGQLTAARRAQRGTKGQEARSLKQQIAQLEAQLNELDQQYPPLCFSEANALIDLEAYIDQQLAEWEQARSAWADEARYNPIEAIQHCDDIVALQARTELIIHLRDAWRTLAESDGRTLAAFRRAYDETDAWRKTEMMRCLTRGPSSSAFRNAVEVERGRALHAVERNLNDIRTLLVWYEDAAAKLQPAA